MPTIKSSVLVHRDGHNLSDEMFYALGVAEEVYREHGFPCIITSLLDGTHNPGSLHPSGNAADLRVKHIPDAAIRTSIYEELKARLSGEGYDVVWEGGVGATPATTGAHVHVEYQPKGISFWRTAA